MNVRIMATLAAGLFMTLTMAYGEDNGNTTSETKRCLPLNSISRIEVVDRQHIKFHMNNRDQYLNTLPRACPGLSRNTPIMYKTSLSELCDLDIITVLHTLGGGLQRGASCGLGTFEPVSSDE